MWKCLSRFNLPILLLYIGFLLLGSLIGLAIGLFIGAVIIAIVIGFFIGLSIGIIANAIVLIIANKVCFKCDHDCC